MRLLQPQQEAAPASAGQMYAEVQPLTVMRNAQLLSYIEQQQHTQVPYLNQLLGGHSSPLLQASGAVFGGNLVNRTTVLNVEDAATVRQLQLLEVQQQQHLLQLHERQVQLAEQRQRLLPPPSLPVSSNLIRMSNGLSDSLQISQRQQQLESLIEIGRRDLLRRIFDLNNGNP